MKYQLVFQFGSQDLEGLLAIEDALTEGLGESADVDGHDAGSGQSSIFIFTRTPTETFQKAQLLLQASKLLPAEFKAASRLLGSEQYTVLWPIGITHFQVLLREVQQGVQADVQ